MILCGTSGAYNKYMNTLRVIENDFTHPLNNAGYIVHHGWSDDIEKQLVELSTQPHILKDTPNDAARRFSSTEAARKWHDDHERSVYTLADQALAEVAPQIKGLIWFGRSERDDLAAEYTFAIRMYDGAQGKGLAKPFMKAAHEDFRNSYDGAIWLETSTDNLAARALYRKVHYSEAAIDDTRVTMIQTR